MIEQEDNERVGCTVAFTPDGLLLRPYWQEDEEHRITARPLLMSWDFINRQAEVPPTVNALLRQSSNDEIRALVERAMRI